MKQEVLYGSQVKFGNVVFEKLKFCTQCLKEKNSFHNRQSNLYVTECCRLSSSEQIASKRTRRYVIKIRQLCDLHP